MKDGQQPFSSGFSEHNEYPKQQVEAAQIDPFSREDELQLDRLMAKGFAWEEAIKLMTMREHIYENGEMNQRIANDPRMQFARWLHENGEMSEL